MSLRLLFKEGIKKFMYDVNHEKKTIKDMGVILRDVKDVKLRFIAQQNVTNWIGKITKNMHKNKLNIQKLSPLTENVNLFIEI